MTFYQQNIDFGIGRHKELVRTGERRALQLAKAAPQAGIGERLYRNMASWLDKQRARWGRDLLQSRATPAHGERSAG
jgi:hypothetical protein